MTRGKWILVGLLAALLAACGSDNGGEGNEEMPITPEPMVDDEPSDSPNDSNDSNDQDVPNDGVAGSDSPAQDPSEDPAEVVDPVEDPAEVDVCETDPHSVGCIDTHVRGQCDIDSGYPGDQNCLLPPPPGQGIQIHIGPEDYDDPDQVAPFIFAAGLESSQCWLLDTPNDEDIHYQGFVLSGRDGTHHIINTAYGTANPAASLGSFGACRRDTADTAGRIPGASKPYMPRFPVAPENENLGYPLAANTPMASDMHYFNYTDEPILREYWLNLYTIPAEQVEVTPNRIRGYGGLLFNITPGTDMVYNYECPINADGRITALLGHTHKHAQRFTAWVNRTATGERVKVFESFDYLEPQIYAYNTVEENPDFSQVAPGAMTGVLEVSAGDTLEWECHVHNTSDVTLTFTNFVETGEMCNIWGESVGPTIDCTLF